MLSSSIYILMVFLLRQNQQLSNLHSHTRCTSALFSGRQKHTRHTELWGPKGLLRTQGSAWPLPQTRAESHAYTARNHPGRTQFLEVAQSADSWFRLQVEISQISFPKRFTSHSLIPRYLRNSTCTIWKLSAVRLGSGWYLRLYNHLLLMAADTSADLAFTDSSSPIAVRLLKLRSLSQIVTYSLLVFL